MVSNTVVICPTTFRVGSGQTSPKEQITWAHWLVWFPGSYMIHWLQSLVAPTDRHSPLHYLERLSSEGNGGARASPSWNWRRGGVHPAQSGSLSQGPTHRDHSHSHSHLFRKKKAVCVDKIRVKSVIPAVFWQRLAWGLREGHFSTQSISFHYSHMVIMKSGWCPVHGWMYQLLFTPLLARECPLNLANMFPFSVSLWVILRYSDSDSLSTLYSALLATAKFPVWPQVTAIKR